MEKIKVENYYHSFNEYLRRRFGERVHKISLNAGFGCPNRDGALSDEGCAFCNEKGFSRFWDTPLSLEEQIASSIEFCRNRFKAEKFIAYFQNGTNTYAPTKKLKETYDIIKKFKEIVGLFISTRPDAVDNDILDLIESYSDDYEVWVEYGIQTVHDKTLETLNRSHTFEDSLRAIEETAKRHIKIGAHIILGLPGETKDDMMETAKMISGLPVSGVKFHVLHVLKNTELENLYKKGSIKLLAPREYVDIVCDFLEYLNPECVILRLVSDANKDALIAPLWVNEKQKIIENVKIELIRRKSFQGKLTVINLRG